MSRPRLCLYQRRAPAGRRVPADVPRVTWLVHACASQEVVKQRMQASNYSGSAVQVARAALASGGLRSLYSGWLSTLLRNAPSNVISFSVYEALRAAQLGGASDAEARGALRTLGPVRSVATGAGAAALCTERAYPWRTRSSRSPPGAARRADSRRGRGAGDAPAGRGQVAADDAGRGEAWRGGGVQQRRLVRGAGVARGGRARADARPGRAPALRGRLQLDRVAAL